MTKRLGRTRRVFLAASALAALSACNGTATVEPLSVEPLTIEALIDVIESSPAQATYLKISTPEETDLLARRDGENFSTEEAGFGAGLTDAAVYLDGAVYITTSDDAGNTKWIRVVGEDPLVDPADYHASVLDTLTTDTNADLSFYTIANLLDQAGLLWSDLSILAASCSDGNCTYTLVRTGVTEEFAEEDARITVETEKVEDGQRLTSLTFSYWDETTLELGYEPQTITAPSDYTDVSIDVIDSGAANEEELQAITEQAETYLRGAEQQAAKIGIPVTSREFWEAYLPENAPEGARLWAALPTNSEVLRPLDGSVFSEGEIDEDLGETLGRIGFHREGVAVCMDFEESTVRPGVC